MSKHFIFVAFLLCILECAGFSAAAQQVVGGNPSVKIGDPQVFVLTYRESGFDADYGAFAGMPEVEFKRLPETGDARPFTMLVPGLNMGLLWDRERRKLYVDANGNGDLTDEPAHDCSVNDEDSQEFHGIRLVKEASPFTVGFIGRQEGRVLLEMHVESGWQGEIELSGVKRAFAAVGGPVLADNEVSQTYLGLLPDSTGNAALPVNSTPLQIENVKRLFVDGHGYELSYAYDRAQSPPTLKVTVQEIECKTLTKSFRGEDLLRVVLRQYDGTVAVIDRPQGNVVIPDRKFQAMEAYLWRADDPQVSLMARGYFGYDDFARTDAAYGEGLSQSLETRRYGTFIGTQLLWKDRAGKTYSAVAVTPGATAPKPKLAIRQGGSLLFDGSLEYG